MKLEEKTLNRKEIFKGKVIEVHLDDIELPNGKKSTREVVNHRGGVCICAMTDEREIIFVRQYRYPYHEVVLELPAGKLEKDSTPLENGKRELLEETGAIGRDYKSLGSVYPSPGYCGETIHLYFCRVAEWGEVCPDEDEFVEIERIPFEKAVQMVLNNEIPDAKSQVAILKTSMLIDQLF